MVLRLTFLSLILLTGTVQAQYYYKDLLVTRQTNEQWQTYRTSHVTGVKVDSYEADNELTEGFDCSQTVGDHSITTYTNSHISGASSLTTYYNEQGKVTKTVDTSDEFTSTSTYTYDAGNRLSRISNVSVTPRNPSSSEVHQWFYTASGEPDKMWRIRNGSDTTYITLVRNEKGQVTEERSRRNGAAEPTIYYYYDDAGRLTDIVRYNRRAQRMLPDYMFEYNSDGKLTSTLIVPEGSAAYQKWYYQYNDKGLKTRETCYNKHKQLLGKIEYTYRF